MPGLSENHWVIGKWRVFFDISFDKAEIHRFSLSVKPYETAFFCGLLRGYYNGLTRDGWWLVTFFWSRWYPDCMEFRYLQVFSCFIPVLTCLDCSSRAMYWDALVAFIVPVIKGGIWRSPLPCWTFHCHVWLPKGNRLTHVGGQQFFAPSPSHQSVVDFF